MGQESKYKTDLSCFLCGTWYGIYLGRKYVAWNFESCAFLLQCRDVFPLWNLGKPLFVWGMGLTGSAIRFWFCLCCSLWFEVSICCHSLVCAGQSLSCSQLVGIFFPGAEESRTEEEEGSLASKHYFLSILCYCCGGQLFLTDWLNFGGCDLFNTVIPIHSSLANIRDDARQEMALIPSAFSAVSSGDLLGVCCPLTPSLPFKWLKLQVQVNMSPWDWQRLAQQLCFPGPAVPFSFCFLL